MFRRGFLRAIGLSLFFFPKFKSDFEWKDVATAPVNKSVWVIFAKDCVKIATLCEDGVWVDSQRWVTHSVTHWMKLTYPDPPQCVLK